MEQCYSKYGKDSSLIPSTATSVNVRKHYLEKSGRTYWKQWLFLCGLLDQEKASDNIVNIATKSAELKQKTGNHLSNKHEIILPTKTLLL